MDGATYVLQELRLAGSGKKYTVAKALRACRSRLEIFQAAAANPYDADLHDAALGAKIVEKSPIWLATLSRHIERIEAAKGAAFDHACRAALVDDDVTSALVYLDEQAGSDPAKLLRQAEVIGRVPTLPHDPAAAVEWLQQVALQLYRGVDLAPADRKALATAVYAWAQESIGPESALAGSSALVGHQLQPRSKDERLASEWLLILQRARELFMLDLGIADDERELTDSEVKRAERLWKSDYAKTAQGDTEAKRANNARQYFKVRRAAALKRK